MAEVAFSKEEKWVRKVTLSHYDSIFNKNCSTFNYCWLFFTWTHLKKKSSKSILKPFWKLEMRSGLLSWNWNGIYSNKGENSALLILSCVTLHSFLNFSVFVSCNQRRSITSPFVRLLLWRIKWNYEQSASLLAGRSA